MNVRELCLGILSFQEASGYEVKKLIEEDVFNHFIDASYGSIYPALTRMLQEGLVSVRAEEQAGRPDKKVYTITEEGRRELARALTVDPAKDKFKSEFLFQVMLNDYLPEAHLSAIYDDHIEYLREELARIDECAKDRGDHPGMAFVAGYGRASLQAGLNFLLENRHMLEEPSANTRLKVIK